MTDDSTTVDVLSLEDFQATLASRLSEVDTVIARMHSELSGRPPALGGFLDAKRSASEFDTLHQQYLQRVDRLRTAIVAAQSATATIIANYRSTEQRNHASAADVGRQLNGVTVALQEGTTSV
jgi:hypothetical protein